MPCDTKVMITLENNAWNKKARQKLGLPVTGALTESDAERVRVEAGKIKAMEIWQELDPMASITGIEAGSDELTIQCNIEDMNL